MILKIVSCIIALCAIFLVVAAFDEPALGIREGWALGLIVSALIFVPAYILGRTHHDHS